MSELVLSLFPGIGLLDMAFEEQGFCVVRGPDLLWGGDVKKFHPPADRFDGIIGGPPCQFASRLRHMVIHNGHKRAENLIPEFERIVREARPAWFVMECVPDASAAQVEGYAVYPLVLNNRWLGEEQNRVRQFSFGVRGTEAVNLWRWIKLAPLEAMNFEPAVCASNGGRYQSVRLLAGGAARRKRYAGVSASPRRTIAETLRLQGFPENLLDEAPFTAEGKRKVIGNGVPRYMGQAIAKAVRAALEMQTSASAPPHNTTPPRTEEHQ